MKKFNSLITIKADDDTTWEELIEKMVKGFRMDVDAFEAFRDSVNNARISEIGKVDFNY